MTLRTVCRECGAELDRQAIETKCCSECGSDEYDIKSSTPMLPEPEPEPVKIYGYVCTYHSLGLLPFSHPHSCPGHGPTWDCDIAALVSGEQYAGIKMVWENGKWEVES